MGSKESVSKVKVMLRTSKPEEIGCRRKIKSEAVKSSQSAVWRKRVMRGWGKMSAFL